MKQVMAKGLSHLVLLVLMILMPAEWTMWHLGENWSGGYLLEQTKGKNYVYNPTYFTLGRSLESLKFQILQKQPAQIVVLGSSRIVTFRESHFSRKSTHSEKSAQFQKVFYNLGIPGGGFSPQRLFEFVQRIQPPYPEIVILGIDQWEIMYSYHPHPITIFLRNLLLFDFAKSIFDQFRYCVRLGILRWHQFRAIFLDHKRTYQRYFHNVQVWFPLMISPKQLTATEEMPIGIEAQLKLDGMGYHSDGSFRYPVSDIQKMKKRYQQQRQAFQGKHLSEHHSIYKAMDRNQGFSKQSQKNLADTVKILQSKGIKVILLSLPYADYIMEEIEARPHIRQLLQDLHDYLQQLANDNSDVSFYNFIRVTSAGCEPYEMRDSFHITGTCATKMLHKLQLDPLFRNL